MTDNVTPINVAINTEAPTPARATLQDNLQLLFGNFFSSLANMITDEVEQRIKAAQVEKANSAPAVPTVDELSESLMLAMQQAEWVKDLLANHVATQDFSDEISDCVHSYMRNVDFSDDVRRALDHYDFSSDIERAVENNYDFDEKIQEAIDNYDFSSDIERAVEDKMSEAKISVQF